jgi:hypothetical protein
MAAADRTPYVHVALRVLDGGRRLWVALDVRAYTAAEAALRCGWNPRHAADGRRCALFRNGSSKDVRCFECVPWGNVALRQDFVRVGVPICTR